MWAGNPELARGLLLQMSNRPTVLLEPRDQALHLVDLCKVGRAKLQKKRGKGKTQLFAYLSDVDKGRVLELTEHPLAAHWAAQDQGRTAFFASLPGTVKFKALQAWQCERELSANSDDSQTANDVPAGELVNHFLSQGVPMIGFGFADNFLMITFGDAIDTHFSLYVSTLAAAGFGNLSSNIVGMGLADTIEHASARLGIPTPKLNAAQRAHWLTGLVGLAGTLTGMTIGCLFGMVPLAWHKPHNHGHGHSAVESSSS